MRPRVNVIRACLKMVEIKKNKKVSLPAKVFLYIEVINEKNICHLQQKRNNGLIDSLLRRCRYLLQIGCRYSYLQHRRMSHLL